MNTILYKIRSVLNEMKLRYQYMNYLTDWNATAIFHKLEPVKVRSQHYPKDKFTDGLRS